MRKYTISRADGIFLFQFTHYIMVTDTDTDTIYIYIYIYIYICFFIDHLAVHIVPRYFFWKLGETKFLGFWLGNTKGGLNSDETMTQM